MNKRSKIPSPRRGLRFIAAATLFALAGAAAAAGTPDPFAAKDAKDVFALLGAASIAPSNAIKITAPYTAESGAVVPVSVQSNIPDTEMIALIIDNNPAPLAALYRLHAGAVAKVDTRVKLLDPSHIRVLVQARGKFYSAAHMTKVVVGGCGGGSTGRGGGGAGSAGDIGAIKVRKKNEDGRLYVGVLIDHPMETGLRRLGDSGPIVPAKDARTGAMIEPHFIERVEAVLNGKTVLEARWGPSVSADPLLGFNLKRELLQPSDRLTVSWRDNRGMHNRAETDLN